MTSTLPSHPDIRRQLKARLLDMTPRAFELFAGELLVYVGLDRVQVTRYIGDGGIDAHGELVAGSGIVRIPAGVQVKRYRSNVQRSDIDRFIGALSGLYSEGIFISTSKYAQQALAKASNSIPRVSPIDGDQVVAMMLRHQLGVETSTDGNDRIDEGYFTWFEVQTSLVPSIVREQGEGYEIDSQSATQQESIEVRPQDDMISLRALGHALRVDTTTIRRWIDSGKLTPDRSLQMQSQEGFFFRRDRIDQIRQQLVTANRPESSVEWRQEFLDFAKSRNLTKSYKPVLIKALFRLVNREGEVPMAALAQEFRAFYLERQIAGLPVERGPSPISDPQHVSEARVIKLIVSHPLERFLIKGFLEYSPQEGVVRFASHLWQDLRAYEVIDVLRYADEQLRYYYSR